MISVSLMRTQLLKGLRQATAIHALFRRGWVAVFLGAGCSLLLGGCCIGNANVGFFRSEAEIRASLLVDTPLGTEAADVLEFALDHSCRGMVVNAGSAYVEALRRERGASPRLLQPTDCREIDAVLSSYAVDLLRGRSVKASWTFDRQDRLIEISVRRNVGL